MQLLGNESLPCLLLLVEILLLLLLELHLHRACLHLVSGEALWMRKDGRGSERTM